MFQLAAVVMMAVADLVSDLSLVAAAVMVSINNDEILGQYIVIHKYNL
jgi:hypothetical protein